MSLLRGYGTVESPGERCPVPIGLPVWVVNNAPVDPLLQDLKVGCTGRLGQIEAQFLCLAVPCVVEAPIMEKAQRQSAHTLTFIH